MKDGEADCRAPKKPHWLCRMKKRFAKPSEKGKECLLEICEGREECPARATLWTWRGTWWRVVELGTGVTIFVDFHLKRVKFSN